MADEHSDDTDEPIVPGPEGELALDAVDVEPGDDAGTPTGAEVPGGEGEMAATDATVSVAPFIDDDDDELERDASVEPDDADGESAAPAKTSKSAVGAAVATGKTKPSKAKGKDKGDAAASGTDEAGPKVTRRVVTSKRVTPKGGGSQKPSGPQKAKGQKHGDDDDEGFRSARYTAPGGQGAYAQGPSPWWVPALLFGFLIIGALIIMLNYMGVFGDAQNLRLVIGLAFILAGILTSTQYR